MSNCRYITIRQENHYYNENELLWKRIINNCLSTRCNNNFEEKNEALLSLNGMIGGR